MTSSTAEPIGEGIPHRWTIVLPQFHSARQGLTFERTPAGGLRLTLTDNSRMHYLKASKVKRRIREATALMVRGQQIPPQEFIEVTVELHHPEKGVKYLRDLDNLSAMAKVVYDAMQPERPEVRKPDGTLKSGRWHGAGIVPDDDGRYMAKRKAIVRGSDIRPWPCIVVHIDGLLPRVGSGKRGRATPQAM